MPVESDLTLKILKVFVNGSVARGALDEREILLRQGLVEDLWGL